MINLKANPFYLTDEQEKWVYEKLNSLTTEQKAGQLFCLLGTIYQIEELKQLVEDYCIGGVLFRPEPTEVIKAKYAQIDCGAVPLLRAANLEEGGVGGVSDGTWFGSQMQVAATDDLNCCKDFAKVCAEEGGAVGVNWTFSPVCDIDLNFRNPITNVRTFGSDPDRVERFALEYVKTIQSEGVAACAKHFPGDGHDFRDQHLHPTVNGLSAEDWHASYGRIYRTLIANGLLSVMVGHIKQPAVEMSIDKSLTYKDCLPASLSKALLTGVLRDMYGFNGVITTDATIMGGYTMAMERRKAIPHTIAAGCDMIVFSTDFYEDYSFLLEGIKSGIVTEQRLNEAVTRILALKAKVCRVETPKKVENKAKKVKDCADKAVTLIKNVGDTVVIKGLTGETIMGVGHPGLFPELIDTETGDCEVTLNADGTFTFKPTGVETGGEEEWTGGTTYENVAYTDDLTMNIYVPTTTQDALPLLVCFPGGGFNFCDPNNVLVLAKYFRDNGFVCATVNYSVGVASYPQAVIDGKTAVQYLVDNAEEYKIDTDAIAVIGESAGSAVASLVSLSGASDFKADGAEDYTFSVNTYIDFYGPVSNGNENIGENVDGGVSAWLGENSAVDLSTYFTGMFSCKNIWIQHGDADTSVNYNHAVLFKAEIDEYNAAQTIPVAQINVHYEIIEGAAHIDPAFYTEANLSAIRDWLYDINGIVTAEVVATYSYSVTSTNPFTNEEVTDVFVLNLYSDGSCTIGIPEGADMVKGPFKGVYTLLDDTVSVTDLSGVPEIGYTFVVDGGFTATVDATANTFTPNA